MFGVAVADPEVEHYREFTVADTVAVDIIVLVAVHGCHVEIEQVGVAVFDGMGDARGTIVFASAPYQKSGTFGYRGEEIFVFRKHWRFILKIFRGLLFSEYFCSVKTHGAPPRSAKVTTNIAKIW